MSAIRRKMHRITPILYTGLTIYYILIYYTVLYTGLTIYYILYSIYYTVLYTGLTVLRKMLSSFLALSPVFMCISRIAQISHWGAHFCCFIVFCVVSLLMILQRHPSNCTNWPLSRRSGSFVEIKVHQAPILRLLPIKKPFSGKSCRSIIFQFNWHPMHPSLS